MKETSCMKELEIQRHLLQKPLLELQLVTTGDGHTAASMGTGAVT